MSTKANRRRRIRQRLFIAQQGKCWLCGEQMRQDVDPFSHPDAATLDHVKPKHLGGTNRQDNLMLAHKRCNSRRGHREDVRAMREEGINATDVR